MNYYNPYFYSIPTNLATSTPRIGLFSRLLGGRGLTFGSILNGTQRALNFANQAIPLVKQVRPMIGNAKTMFRVMNEFKRVETPNQKTSKSNYYSNINSNQSDILDNSNYETIEESYENGPTFFI